MEIIFPQISLIDPFPCLLAWASPLNYYSLFLHSLSICLNTVQDLLMCREIGPSLGDPACHQPIKASRDASYYSLETLFQPGFTYPFLGLLLNTSCPLHVT